MCELAHVRRRQDRPHAEDMFGDFGPPRVCGGDWGGGHRCACALAGKGRGYIKPLPGSSIGCRSEGSSMAGPNLEQPDARTGAQGFGFGRTVSQLRRWPRRRLMQSRPNSRKIGSRPQTSTPRPDTEPEEQRFALVGSPGRPFLRANSPADRTSGRPWATPIIEIPQRAA